MKKSFIAVAFIATLVSFILQSCLKADTQSPCTLKPVNEEKVTIDSFATAKGLTLTQHSSGVHYQILNPGSGTAPSLTSKVFVTYTGTFLNGTKFDELTDVTKSGWPLNNLISGWQVGLPLIKPGGEIILVIPSSLGYGCATYSGIPGNSILYFNIKLERFE